MNFLSVHIKALSSTECDLSATTESSSNHIQVTHIPASSTLYMVILTQFETSSDLSEIPHG